MWMLIGLCFTKTFLVICFTVWCWKHLSHPPLSSLWIHPLLLSLSRPINKLAKSFLTSTLSYNTFSKAADIHQHMLVTFRCLSFSSRAPSSLVIWSASQVVNGKSFTKYFTIICIDIFPVSNNNFLTSPTLPLNLTF